MLMSPVIFDGILAQTKLVQSLTYQVFDGGVIVYGHIDEGLLQSTLQLTRIHSYVTIIPVLEAQMNGRPFALYMHQTLHRVWVLQRRILHASGGIQVGQIECLQGHTSHSELSNLRIYCTYVATHTWISSYVEGSQGGR